MRLAAAAVTGYVIGTLPSAATAAKLATKGAVDIHTAGTGNPGAMNAISVLGKKWGLVVMAADIAKGIAACQAGRRFAPEGGHVAGTAAVIGHCYPAWTGFKKGGKGVATGVGQCIATFPVMVPANLAVAATTAVPKLRNRSRAAMVVSSITWVLSALLWHKRKLPNAWGPPATKALPLAAAASSAVILQRFYRES